jgi:two-component system, OmpR family, alkaline phosphatase synthesis response regulator PhoP
MAKKILIIENETDVNEILEKELTEQGYEVVIAASGQEGLSRARALNPDLVLLDLSVLEGGFEILYQIRKSFKDLPVIVISNSGQEFEVKQAEDLGAEDLVAKTQFDPQAIIKKIKNLI